MAHKIRKQGARETPETLNAEEAARLLRLNVKRVQQLARAGKLPAARVGRKWLFRREELEAILGRRSPVAADGSLAISARNRLRGRVARVIFDGLMAEVHVRIGDQLLVSLITRSSAERLGIEVGDQVLAVIKSTEVMIGKEVHEP
jgi:molybdopterin-binding protein